MLRIELINLFIAATIFVLNEHGLHLKRERLSCDNLPHTLHDINVMFGINGSVAATIVMGMDGKFARKLASLVLDRPVVQTEFAGNTVTMVACEIAARIVKNMNKLGHDVFPRHPSVIKGRGTELSVLKTKKLVVGFETEAGTIDLRICVE